MNYADLKANLQAIIGRAPPTICYSMVTADLNRDLRLSAMLRPATLEQSTNMSLPADFLQVSTVYIDSEPPVMLRPSASEFWQEGAGEFNGEYCIRHKTMLMNATRDLNEVKLVYYAELDPLELEESDNFVLLNHPDAYVYGALAHHYALIRDTDAAQVHAAQYFSVVEKIQRSDRNKRTGGASIKPRVTVA